MYTYEGFNFFYVGPGSVNGEPQGGHMTVRTIPANHVPGAVMFLFDDDEKKVLYTGDFRYDEKERNYEISKLYDFVEDYGETIIDYLYVDVTCLDFGKLYRQDQNRLPSPRQIKDELLWFAEENTVKSIHLDGSQLGWESISLMFAEEFNTLVGIPEGSPRKRLHKYLLGM